MKNIHNILTTARARVVVARVPVVLSLAVGSIALAAATLTGLPVGGQYFAFGGLEGMYSSASQNVLRANPNPIQVCDDASPAGTVLSWTLSRTVQYDLRQDSGTGPVLKRGTGSSKLTIPETADADEYFLTTYRAVRVRQGGKVVTQQMRNAQYNVVISHTSEGCAEDLDGVPTPTPTVWATPTPTPTATPTPTPTVVVTPTPTPTVVATPTPTPIPNRVPVSAVDTASCDQGVISGWAADPDSLNTVVKVRLMEGATLLAEKVTDVQRDDVNTYLAATYNAGRPVTAPHGFSFDLSGIRLDGKSHLFSLELVDNTGAIVKINLGSSANLYCPAQTQFLGAITIPSTVDVCPGPDALLGTKKVDFTAWANPNGGSVWVTNGSTGQEKLVTALYGPTVQTNSWIAQLAPGQNPVTYTFRVSSYYSGANTVATKAVQVRPLPASCDPAEYQMSYVTDGTYCPAKGQTKRLHGFATVRKAHTNPPLGPNDKITVKFRPLFAADIPENWRTLSLSPRSAPTSEPNTFYFDTGASSFPVDEIGFYRFFLNFRGHTEVVEYVEALPGPFCQ